MHCCSCFRHGFTLAPQQADRTAHLARPSAPVRCHTLKRQAPAGGWPARSRRPCPSPGPTGHLHSCQHPVRVCSAAMHRVECSAQQAKVGVGGGTKEVRPVGRDREAITELISQSEAHPPPACSPAASTWEAVHTCPASGSGSPGAPGRRHTRDSFWMGFPCQFSTICPQRVSSGWTSCGLRSISSSCGERSRCWGLSWYRAATHLPHVQLLAPQREGTKQAGTQVQAASTEALLRQHKSHSLESGFVSESSWRKRGQGLPLMATCRAPVRVWATDGP